MGTYAQDLQKVLGEIYRVIKPGAKISLLDGVMLDGYDGSDPHNLKLLRETREVTGWGHFTHHSDWAAAVKAAGFVVIHSKDPGWSPDRVGSQSLLVEKEARYFGVLAVLVKVAAWMRIIPKHIDVLLERLNRYGESYIEMDKKNMLTTGWHILAQKPLTASRRPQFCLRPALQQPHLVLSSVSSVPSVTSVPQRV